MPEIEKAPLSIGSAYDQGLATPPAGQSSEGQPAGSEANKGKEPEKPAEGQGKDPKKPEEADPNKKQDLNPDGTPKVPPADPGKKDPIIDPDKGKYEGEYTPDRFNGLMSAWQKDRANSLKVPDLEKKILELEQLVKNPKPAEKGPEGSEELPSELKDADPDVQKGFQLLQKANNGTLSAMETKIVNKILETINRPEQERNEVVTKVKQETEELSIEFGKNFSENEQAIKKYAVEHQYPLGTLRHAYQAWQKDRELAELKEKANGGKKTLAEIEAEKAKQGEIPHGSANRSGEFPKWDEKRDGDKTLSQLFDEVKSTL